MTVLVFLLIYTIILKFFPPKKPNFYYGYQLGGAKESRQAEKFGVFIFNSFELK
nr:hypothetical protein [uncultured Flavobacterium sp.]